VIRVCTTGAGAVSYGVMRLLLATMTLDLSNYLTFLFVDSWLWNWSSRLPGRLRAEVVEGKHESKKRRPSFTCGRFGSAADVVRICRVSAFVLPCNLLRSLLAGLLLRKLTGRISRTMALISGPGFLIDSSKVLIALHFVLLK
jgi:hypothetical protein